jgi:hypothetical protein
MPAAVAHDVGNQVREFSDRDIRAYVEIQMRGIRVVVHDMHQSVSHIVDEEQPPSEGDRTTLGCAR